MWGVLLHLHAVRTTQRRATFQRLMHIALGQLLGRNTEAYVDDIVVKSREAKTLIQDL